MPFDVPYRGELVGSRVNIIAPTPFYNSADDSNPLGYLSEGDVFMIMAYIDSDPSRTTQPIFLVVANPEKKLFIIAKDDAEQFYRLAKPFPWLWGLIAIGLFFAFGKRRRVSHG